MLFRSHSLHIDGGGKIISTLQGGRAKRKETPLFAIDGILKIRSETEIAANKGRFATKIAGSNGEALIVHDINIGCLDGGINALQFVVDRVVQRQRRAGCQKFLDVLDVGD